jgi:cystathionine beta-lyase
MKDEPDFDLIIDRRGSAAVKWEALDKTPGREEVIPLWVADMDFPVCPAIAEALAERARHPVYGYTVRDGSYFETLRDWYGTRYGADLSPGDFLDGPGAVPSLGVALRSFSGAGEGALVFTPVYHPFFDMIRRNGREIVEAPLIPGPGGRYSFTRETMETALAGARDRGIPVSLILFCSPHNPGGAVWGREELETLLAFAADRGLTVISDEIHGDFVYPPKQFLSLAAFPGHASRTVVISSANKSFNLAGFHHSHFAARDPRLREALGKELGAMGFHGPEIFAMIAADAAYRRGGPWLDRLKAYLWDNIEAAARYLNAEIPGVRAYPPEGTYLIWADISAPAARRGLKDGGELARRLETEGRVKVLPGSAFGDRGKDFIRINAACPRPRLMEALRRFRDWANTG